jgi:hypothetical protein
MKLFKGGQRMGRILCLGLVLPAFCAMAGSEPVLTVTPQGGNLTLTWLVNGHGFKLQSSPDLAAGSWVAMTNPITVANGMNSVTDPISGRGRFYRLAFTPADAPPVPALTVKTAGNPAGFFHQFLETVPGNQPSPAPGLPPTYELQGDEVIGTLSASLNAGAGAQIFDASGSLDPRNYRDGTLSFKWQIYWSDADGGGAEYISQGMLGTGTPVMTLLPGALPDQVQMNGDVRSTLWRVKLTVTHVSGAAPLANEVKTVWFRFQYLGSGISMAQSAQYQLRDDTEPAYPVEAALGGRPKGERPSSIYLMSNMYYNDERLVMLAGRDGANFEPLVTGNINHAVNGAPGAIHTVRDPSIIYDNGSWWCVATDGSNFGGSTFFRLWKSADLVNWTFVTNVSVGGGTGGYTWAPEWFRDVDGTLYVVYMRFAGSAGVNANLVTSPTNAAKTTWSTPTALTKSGGGNVFAGDPQILRYNGSYYMIGSASNTPDLWKASVITGPWSVVRSYATNWIGVETGEGWCLTRNVDHTWTIYYLNRNFPANTNIAYRRCVSDGPDLETAVFSAPETPGLPVIPGDMLSHGTILRIDSPEQQAIILNSVPSGF